MAEPALIRHPNPFAWGATWLCLVVALALMSVAPARAAPFAAVVMDARTGEVLHSINGGTRLHPASLTKMMTLYVVFEAIRNGEISLDTMVRVSARAAAEPPSRLGLRAGQRIAVRHLIRAAALRSGNDAATALAEAVSGSVEAFARRMTRTGIAMGLTRTTFRNANGLTQSGHMSSALDMSIIGRQLYFDFPEYYSIFSRRSDDAGIATVSNTNGRFLDGYRGADGIKTGFTSAAGYNLTAMAERNGVRIIVTVFGGRSVAHRHEQVVALMDRGFREAPARAAVRRPARPNYSRPAPAAPPPPPTAEAPRAPQAEQAPRAESRAAGRVIRLQTAPSRSIHPRPRPGPDAPSAPPEALLAAMHSGIDATLAEIAQPPAAQPPAAPPPAADGVPDAVAAAPPGRSPRPRLRPQTAVAMAPADRVAADVEAARAAGFSVIGVDEYAALSTSVPAPAPPPQATTAGALAPIPDSARVPPNARPSARPVARAPDPADAEASDPDLPDIELIVAPTLEPALDTTLAAATPPVDDPAEVIPIPDPVPTRDGILTIPGLPPIAVATPVPMAPPPPEPVVVLPALDQRPEAALVVTAEGQVLWQDEDILTAIDQIAPQVVGPGTTVLTTGDMPASAPAPGPILPQIVVGASTSGGQLWSVDLGPYPSRFDAERTLLRVALAESATLGGGVRRVVEGGRGHRAMVLSLTRDQADRACLRLSAQAQTCAVVAP